MLRFLRLQEGWLTVGLLALLLFSVTLSIEQAQWADGLSILTPITLIGLITGIVLAKIKGVPRFLLDLLGLEVGIITVLVSVASVMRDPQLITIQDKVQDLLARTATWVNIAVRQDMSDDLHVFILSLAIVCWVLAYSSAYFVFRSRQLWWALVPNGVALMINLSYSLVNLNGYIIVFMFSALLLMIRFNLLMHEERWQRERVNYSPNLAWAFLWAGSAASVVLALAMWYVPTQQVNGTLSRMWDQVNQPWVDFQTSMSRLWSQVPGNQSIGGYSSFNKSFTMGGSLNLSDSPALFIKSSEPHYWRATTYDEYTGTGWRNTAADTFNVPGLSSRLALEANQQLISQDQARQEVTYTVQVLAPKGDVIFASLRPVRLTTPTRLEVSWRKLDEIYSIDRIYGAPGGANLSSVPLELRSLMGLVREAQRELQQGGGNNSADGLSMLYSTARGPEIQQQASDLQHRGINVTFDVGPAPSFPINIRSSGEVPVYDDVVAVHAPGNLSRDDQYSVVSLVSSASDSELRAASTDYSQESWLTSRYLSLPATVPQSVRDLAQKIVVEANATNPYDMAKAIETYLRTNYKYNTSIPQPPPGVDRVEWFLFQGKEGYCEYYSSAMVVMLRSLGIPSREATGYAPGTWDAAKQGYLVKESAAHAWPEVYFPGYGWIEFEPTPSQAVLSRNPDQANAIPSPAASPVGTVVPTANPNGVDDLKNPQIPTLNNTSNQGPPMGLILPAALTVLALLVGAAIWLPISPLRRKNIFPLTATNYYGKMLGWARLLRIGPAVHQTPYEFSEALAREVPGTSLLTRTITRAYVRERFSGHPVNVEDRVSVGRAWETLRARLWRSLPMYQLRRLIPRRRT